MPQTTVRLIVARFYDDSVSNAWKPSFSINPRTSASHSSSVLGNCEGAWDGFHISLPLFTSLYISHCLCLHLSIYLIAFVYIFVYISLPLFTSLYISLPLFTSLHISHCLCLHLCIYLIAFV